MAAGQQGSGKGFAEPRYRALIQQLVDERKRQGLSQEAVALVLGRHQQFVSRYETGERRLDIVEFADVATALGLDPPALLHGIEGVKSAKS